MSTHLSWQRGYLLLIHTGILAVSVKADPLQLLSTLDPAQQPAGGSGDSAMPILSSGGRFVLFASSDYTGGAARRWC